MTPAIPPPRGSLPSHHEIEVAPVLPPAAGGVPAWAQAIGAALIVAAVGALWTTTTGRLAELERRADKNEARITASETDAARRGAQLDALVAEVRDLRTDMKAGFAALSQQITAATPRKDRP